jgi:hypothetical protein
MSVLARVFTRHDDHFMYLARFARFRSMRLMRGSVDGYVRQTQTHHLTERHPHCQPPLHVYLHVTT